VKQGTEERKGFRALVNEEIRTGVKRELKDGENKRMIKFGKKSVK
jgi:hypothetical protein